MKYFKIICFAVVGLSIVLSSCRRATLLGVDVLPDSDNITGIFTDSFSLITNTVRDGSVITSSVQYHQAGNMYDPVFGKTFASIFTEFDLPSNAIDVGDRDTLFIDSVVLALRYHSFYGYREVPQSFIVYELTQSISPVPETGYYSNNSFDHKSNVIGNKINFVANIDDSVSILGLKLPPQLRIQLDHRFGQKFLNQSGDSALYDLVHFQEFFKGLLISPDTVTTPFSGGLISFDLASIYSGLAIYYHTLNPENDSLVLRFPITDNSGNTSFYSHNHNGSLVKNHVKRSDKQSDSLVFIQPMGGLKTRIRIPYIHNLKNVLINKAELVLTQVLDANSSDTIFFEPDQLICVKADSNGKDIILPDALDGFPSSGGTRSTFTNSAGQEVAQYKFSIAQQLQLIIDEETEDYGLYLIAFRRSETANRIMAGGADRTDDMQLKLNLIYTPID